MKRQDKKSLINSLGWCFIALVPIFSYQSFNGVLDEKLSLFIALMMTASLMWSLNWFVEFVPALFVLCGVAVFDLAPSKVILSGYASEAFMMIIGLMIITTIITNSGIILRVIFYILSMTRHNPQMYDKCCFILFTVATPLLPANITRMELAANLIKKLSMFWGLPKMRSQHNRLVISSFQGSSILGTCFISASLMNFMVNQFITVQEEIRFGIEGWLKASFIALIVLIIGYIIVHKFIFRNQFLIDTHPEVIQEELEAMGTLSLGEIFSLGSIAVLVMGMLTYPIHRISPTFIALTLTCIIMILEVVDAKTIMRKINWTIIFLIGSAVSISKLIIYFEIDKFVSQPIALFLLDISHSKYILYIFVIITTFIVRLFLPITATVSMLLPILLPLHIPFQVSAWSIAFVILTITDAWFFPYQSYIYTFYKMQLEQDEIIYDEKIFLKFQRCINIFRVLAVLASVFYWDYVT
ncbi:MAG: hypothetical protein C0432_01235 [Candidatus Puniceispirillum sp.]|nr:hypothetical protein [Candidatus Pelagibacter sp.]MBA4282905.1 hypothetical protein [Candidatus Puniceispirillum sp.]